MNTLREAKKQYEEIPIPEELSERVNQEIRRGNQRRGKKLLFARFWKGTAAAAAAAVVFTTALNTSTAFAESVSQIPVIGEVARVLTFRSYQKADEDMKISVEIPTIEMISEDLDGLEDSVNEEILNLCEQYAEEARERALEYRKAFLETGGTLEEWEAHHIEIRVWYEVKSQTERYLSLAVMGTENWVSAYSKTRYYNLDLEDGKLVTLADLLGGDYKQTVDEQIREQMKERSEDGTVYFEGFEGIDENTPFYINETGNPVVVFEAYEIAPGSEGTQEFEITQPAAAQVASASTKLSDVTALVGMKDEDTENLLGGGTENWTEDHSFYIGRIYEVKLAENFCKVFTTCGEDGKVESVSLWIVNGERQVTDAEALMWEQQVTDMMGAEPSWDKGISEGGSRNCRWTAAGLAASMNWMEDILTISFQPAVGELT